MSNKNYYPRIESEFYSTNDPKKDFKSNTPYNNFYPKMPSEFETNNHGKNYNSNKNAQDMNKTNPDQNQLYIPPIEHVNANNAHQPPINDNNQQNQLQMNDNNQQWQRPKYQVIGPYTN